MNRNIKITNNATGASIIYVDEYWEDPDEEGGRSIFMWEEGNFSCDCNRRILFERARGGPENLDLSCSEGGYSIEYLDKWEGEKDAQDQRG